MNEKNQRTNGPVYTHLISGSSISTYNHTKPGKMAEQTLTLITHEPLFNSLVN